MSAQPVSLFDQVDYANVLYYGPQGTGKTSNVAAMARLGKTIIVNAEGGLKKGPLARLGVPVENIRPVKCRSYDDLNDLFEQVRDNLEQYEVGDPARVVGLGLDSVTEITKTLVELASERRVEKLTRRGVVADPFETDRDDYGRMTEQMRRLIRRYRDLECHLAVTALEKRDTSNGELALLPALTPAFATDLMGYVDLVVYSAVADLGQGELEFVGITRPMGKYRGKDRYGVTAPVTAYPTMDRLVSLINGELDLAQDPQQQAYVTRMARETGGATPSDSGVRDSEPEPDEGD